MNAAVIEWVWLGVAMGAWIIKTFLLASARANYRHYRQGTPVQIFMSRSIYYHMVHMFVAFTMCVIAAIWAVLHQPPPPPIHQTQSFMIAVYFLGVNTVLLVHALKVAQWWNRLEDGHYNGAEHPSQIVTTVETKISSATPPTIHVNKNGHAMDDA